jgi:hypothetical protein
MTPRGQNYSSEFTVYSSATSIVYKFNYVFETLKCFTEYIISIIVSIVAGGAAQHFRALLIPKYFEMIL